MQNLQHKHQKQLTMQRRRPVWQDRKSGNAPFRPGAAAPPGFGRWAWRPGAAPPATPPGPPPSTPLPPALHQAPTQHEVLVSCRSVVRGSPVPERIGSAWLQAYQEVYLMGWLAFLNALPASLRMGSKTSPQARLSVYPLLPFQHTEGLCFSVRAKRAHGFAPWRTSFAYELFVHCMKRSSLFVSRAMIPKQSKGCTALSM